MKKTLTLILAGLAATVVFRPLMNVRACSAI